MYSAKFLRAVNFADFAVSLHKCENLFCENEQAASHVARLCLQFVDLFF